MADKDLTFFDSILDKNQIVTDKDDLVAHNFDFWKKFSGNSSLMLKPRTNEEISAILRYCNEKKIAIVPQGGNTGLVGGSQPIFDEVILSLSNMNKVLGFDESYGIVTS